MNAEEYENLERVEEHHWYYAGKREFIRNLIETIARPRADSVLLDCGAGTGRFGRSMQDLCRVLVLDNHEESLRLLRRHFKPDQVIALEGNAIPLADHSVDVVTALDVLEHIGPDREAVQGFHRVLKRGGYAFITVPASMALWSDWDVGLHHFRRYTRKNLLQLFPSGEWEILRANYTNVVVFPAVWFARKALRAERTGGRRIEDDVPPGMFNRFLKWVFVRTALLRIPMPFGVSLVLVARKR